MTEPAICTIWHPKVNLEMVRPLVKGRVLSIYAKSVEEALKQLPSDIYVNRMVSTNNETVLVVLLRAPRAVMEILRDEGWHAGHWRDEVTGQDNGIRRLFASKTDKPSRSAGLRDIIHTLHQEVRQMAKGVVTLWQDEITLEMVEGIYDKSPWNSLFTP